MRLLLLSVLLLLVGVERLLSAYFLRGLGVELSSRLLVAYLGLGAGLMLLTLACLSRLATRRH